LPYFLGIDVGTSALKTLLISDEGKVISSASVDYPLLTPRPNWAEQDPAIWWDAAVRAAKECLGRGKEVVGDSLVVEALGLSGQMHGSVFINGEGGVLRPAILWCDQRTEEQCGEINDKLGFNKLIGITGNRAVAGFTAPKILWLRRNEPEIYRQVEKVLLPKDYIRYKLTGEFATEVSDASGTLLFNVKERKWSEEMLDTLDIPRRWMPDCYESTKISGCLSKKGAIALGLPEGIPVVGGGGDQAAGAVGNGIVVPGAVSCVLGTSGVVFWHSEEPLYDTRGRLHAFCHAVPGKWHLMGVTLSAGGSLKWFKDNLCPEEIEEARRKGVSAYQVIDEKAEAVDPGCEGLLFLPYLAGERTPYADASARGAFVGLSLRHSRAHMARSVMEGVSMSLKDCLELGRECGVEAHRLYLSGGGARSPLWRQIAADIWEKEINVVGANEGPAFGAAILAAVGVGVYQSVEDACNRMVATEFAGNPLPENLDLYRDIYQLFRPMYSSLKDFFMNNRKILEKHY